MKQTLLAFLLLAFVGCQDKPNGKPALPVNIPDHPSSEKYPQILVNGCGQYIVKWYDIVSNNDHDTSCYYVGMFGEHGPVKEYWVMEGPAPEKPLTKLEIQKGRIHAEIWSTFTGDTIFNATEPMIFKDSSSAAKAITSGHNKEKEEARQLDSLVKCNTYHKI